MGRMGQIGLMGLSRGGWHNSEMELGDDGNAASTPTGLGEGVATRSAMEKL